MKKAGELQQQLQYAEDKLCQMLEEGIGPSFITNNELQGKIGSGIRDQQITVAWLKAEYTGQLLQGLRECADEAEIEEALGEASPHTREYLEAIHNKLGQLRAKHLDALASLQSYDNWQEVVQRYEASQG